MPEIFFSGITIGVVALLLGVFYGLAQMVLLSTLIIDTTDSFQRTEANYVVSWVLRLALAIGPLVGMAMSVFLPVSFFPRSSACCLGCLCAVGLPFISGVHFPFKAPDERHVCWSTDRYLLLRGCPLFSRFCLPR